MDWDLIFDLAGLVGLSVFFGVFIAFWFARRNQAAILAAIDGAFERGYRAGKEQAWSLYTGEVHRQEYATGGIAYTNLEMPAPERTFTTVWFPELEDGEP